MGLLATVPPELLQLQLRAQCPALGSTANPTMCANHRRRPAPNVDGTVHESSNDVLVRVRQLLSLLETQYSGDTVVIVAPDRWVGGRWLRLDGQGRDDSWCACLTSSCAPPEGGCPGPSASMSRALKSAPHPAPAAHAATTCRSCRRQYWGWTCGRTTATPLRRGRHAAYSWLQRSGRSRPPRLPALAHRSASDQSCVPLTTACL